MGQQLYGRMPAGVGRGLDAPGHDEIVVAVGASGGRPHHRISDRLQDMAFMGGDQAGRRLKA